MILPITLTTAGAATLLNIWLALRVGRLRIANKVLIGDGAHPGLSARMRAHANYVEYTPFFLILLGLIEFGMGSATWLWGVAIVYVIGRILHAFGMDKTKPNKLRMIGILLTIATLLLLSGVAIGLAYGQPDPARMEMVPAGQASLEEGGTKLN